MPTKSPNLKALALFLTLLTGVLISALFLQSANTIIRQAEHQLEADAQRTATILNDEIMKYEFGLQGARGAIIADKFRYDAKTFREYAESRDMFSNFSGATGFGFSRKVEADQLAQFEKEQLKKNKNFKIHPRVKADTHFVVELFEPAEAVKSVFGYDLAAEDVRRKTAEIAATTGNITISKKIPMSHHLVGHDGFIYFIPVYKTISTPETEQERLKNLVGWVFTSVTLEKLLQKITAKIPPHLSLRIEVEGDPTDLFLGPRADEGWSALSPKIFPTSIAGQTWILHATADTKDLNKTLLLMFVIYLGLLTFTSTAAYLIYKNILRRDQSIAESKSWLKAVIDSAGLAVITIGRDGLINNFNSEAEKILGYKADEMIGKANPAIFHDPIEVFDRAQELSRETGRHILPGLEVFTANPSTGVPEVREWTYVRKNGSRVPVRLCVTKMVDSEGQIVGYVGIAEDLSEQKKMTSTIEEQRARMSESAKMSLLGEMAGGIAHEINTPLAVILLKAGILIEEVETLLPDHKEIVEDLKKISKTAQRISKIVKGLRLFSRKADNDPMEKMQISSVIESTLDLCGEKMHNLQIDLKVHLSENGFILARATEISQVLMNLIGNSVDAVMDRPERWIHVASYGANGKIVISVTDSGHGIPPKVVEKMMNPFFTTKELGKGTGLGLSISKGIIEAHGGTLQYDASHLHTRFIIELPAVAEPQVGEAA